jgi:hypothetical protein
MLTCIALLATVLALFACYGRDTVSVVDVRRTSLAEARRALREAGLEVGALGRRYAVLPVGQVVDQQPQPREQVAADTKVTLVVSRGVEVPRVVGSVAAVARSDIRDSDLQAAPMTKRFDDAPKGTVISQDPPAGRGAEPGSSVALVISDGVDTGNNSELAECMPRYEAEAAIGLRLAPLDPVEACGFVRAGKRPARARCPPSWVCSWDESGRWTIRLGADQEAMIIGGAWRFVPAYPSADPVRDFCRFLRGDPREEYQRESGQPFCR